ncbi:Fucose permease [Noviherbaspirillum humi]|uniref:Fucose permease n=1 Tax=Noviherbaspirillum humi TaxID=1688639 RepID=A0A239HQ28_9BURK|nr:MFS transporter [Noviherbaspirillum humi]SNS83442.1 Fucose permease [Noviherbaspirillum humi]
MDTVYRLRASLSLNGFDARLRMLALPLQFALFGLLMGSWAGRIPALQEGLQISHTTLSYVLLSGGLGGVLSHPFAGWMMSRLGGRRALLAAGLALCVVLPAIGLAPTVPALMLAVLMLGICGGCFGVAVNSVASRHEKATGKSEMSLLHACGCAGSLIGALIGSYAASQQIEPAAHFIRIVLPIALLLWIGFQLLPEDRGAEQSPAIAKRKFALPGGRLVLLGLLGFCAAMSENSIADWSGVYLKEHFGVSDGFAPLALSTFTVMMLLSRLVGDRLKARHGARRLITLGAGLSAIGLFLSVFAPNPHVALVGFGLSGIGLSLVFPFILSAVGKEGPMALAGVATMSNVGGLAGPPVVGAMADHLGMQATIGFIGVLSIIISLVASRSSMLK